MWSTRSVVVACLSGALTLFWGLAPHDAVGATCTLYGSEASDLDRDFWVLDQTTAGGQEIGDMGGEITGIAVHPFTGVLYGVTAAIQLGPQNFDPGDLVTIDPTTGAATRVGSLGLADLTAEGPTLADIAFDPATGVLYGWRARRAGDLYRVNLDTGAATLVGDSGLDLSGGQGLTFGPQNRLFLAGEGTGGMLRTIDKLTGLSIDSVQLSGYAGDSNIGALAFDGRRIFGVTTDDSNLITIDPSTGVITAIGETESDALDGLAFDCDRNVRAPAMSRVALACLALGLLVLGLSGRRIRSSSQVH